MPFDSLYLIGIATGKIRNLGLGCSFLEDPAPPWECRIVVHAELNDTRFNLAIPEKKLSALLKTDALERYVLFHLERAARRLSCH